MSQKATSAPATGGSLEMNKRKSNSRYCIQIVLCTRKQHKTTQITQLQQAQAYLCTANKQVNKTRIDLKDSMHSKQVMKHANKTTQQGLIKIGDASDMQTNRFK